MVSFYTAVLSGLLTGLAFDSPCLSFLAWVSLIPCFYVINRSGRRQTFFSGLLFGVSYYASSIFWIGSVSKLGLLFLVSYLSLYYALLFVLISFFINKKRALVNIPALWVAIELIKEKVWCGFFCGNLGYSQYANIHLIQLADLGGTKLLTFLIVLVNLSGWIIFSRFRNKKIGFISAARPLFIPLMVFSISLLYSAYKIAGLEFPKAAEIFIIQPNISQGLKWKDSLAPMIKSKLLQLAGKAPGDSLVVFPEASWPEVLNIDETDELKGFVRGLEREVLIGSVILENGKFYNSAIMLNRKGQIVDLYRKIKLVPFGEYVPLREYLKFINVLNSIGDTTPGDKVTLFSYKGSIFSVLICFEDIFPSHVRYFAAKSDFLINITNDAWFKGEPEASQHLGIMALRAVENRITVLRSANTGISGWVSPSGRIEKLKKTEKEVFVSARRGFTIPINKHRSFYNKHGDIFSYICVLYVLLILAVKPKGTI